MVEICLESNLPLFLTIDNKVNILLVEDEFKVSEFIKKGLQEQLHHIDIAHDGIFGEKLAIYCPRIFG